MRTACSPDGATDQIVHARWVRGERGAMSKSSAKCDSSLVEPVYFQQVAGNQHARQREAPVRLLFEHPSLFRSQFRPSCEHGSTIHERTIEVEIPV